jgi:hypothetical protein
MAADHGTPIAYLAAEPGTPVLTSDGEQVGLLERVLADETKDIFDGLVVDTRDGDRFVDAPDVEALYERAIVLKLSAEQAKSLKEPEPAPAVIDVNPEDPVDIDPDGVGGAGPVDKLRHAAHRLQWRMTGRYQPKGRD